MPPFRKRGAGTAFWPWLGGSLLPSPREGVSKEGGHAGPPSLCRRGGVQGNPIERVPLAPLFHRARRILSPGERMGGASCREPAPPVPTEKGKSPARGPRKAPGLPRHPRPDGKRFEAAAFAAPPRAPGRGAPPAPCEGESSTSPPQWRHSPTSISAPPPRDTAPPLPPPPDPGG